MDRLMSLFGMVLLLAIAYGFSKYRNRVNWRTVAVGLGLQLVLGILLLKIEFTANAFSWFSYKVASFLDLADEGSRFVFGNLADPSQFGFIFAIKVVPTIIFFSAFISIMYYLGVVQLVVNVIAHVMRITMGTSGAETLSCSANIFVGQTEAPLLIKPFVERMTASELHAVMVGGFATIAGGVLAAYIGMGVPPNHLIIASVMSAPAALVMAKLLMPETEHSETAGDAKLPEIKAGDNLVDAAARGTTDGMKLAFNVVAMLIAFISLIAVVDWVLGGIDYYIDGRLIGGEPFAVGMGSEFRGFVPGSLRTLFGTLLGPLAFAMGVPWRDAGSVGNLLGIKICANEFVAYGELSNLINGYGISERSKIIATYALCGFANFGSIGIQIGGISAIAPSRRTDLARLGVRAMIGGALASWLTATIAGALITVPFEKPFAQIESSIVEKVQIEEEYYRVRRIVNKVHHDGLQLLEPGREEGVNVRVARDELGGILDHVREALDKKESIQPAEFDNLVRQAEWIYRGQLDQEDLVDLMQLYRQACQDGRVDAEELDGLLSRVEELIELEPIQAET